MALWSSGETWRIANNAEGRAELMRRLTPLKPAMVAFEARGGYERAFRPCNLWPGPAASMRA